MLDQNQNTSSLNENWEVLLSLFPKNWRSLAKETGAMVRKLRNFKSEDAVMRTLLIHIAKDTRYEKLLLKQKWQELLMCQMLLY